MHQYFNGKSILTLIFITLFLSACAETHAYNPDNPEAYRKHWENNEQIKDNKLLYQLSEECKESGNKKNNSCL